MNTLDSKRELRQQQLMEVALELFAEQGFEKTTIRMIAQKAGIALGLLYNYYPSKEALLLALFRKEQRELQLLMTHENEFTLALYIRNTVKAVKQNSQFWRLIYGLRLQAGVGQQLEAETKSHTDAIQKQVEASLNQNNVPFPGLEAKLILANLDGIINHYLLYPNYPIDDIANLLLLKYR